MDFRGESRTAVRVGLLVTMLLALAFPAAAGATSTSAEVTPTLLDFEQVPIGYTSEPQTITIKAIGDSPMTITNIGFYYEDGYAIANEVCTQEPIPVGSSCTIDVEFTPIKTGETIAALGIDDASGGYNEVALTGVGVEPSPAISVTPSSLDFGAIPVDSELIAPQVVTVHSTGSAPLVVNGATITGPGAARFSADASACAAAPVNPNGTCQVEVTASQAVPGAHLATLEISSNAGPDHTLVDLRSDIGTLPGNAKLSVKLKAPQKTRAGGFAVLTATIRNLGTATSKGFTISASGPARSTRKVSLKASGLAPGRSVVRKLRLPIKKGARGAFKAVVRLVAVGEKPVTATTRKISITRSR